MFSKLFPPKASVFNDKALIQYLQTHEIPYNKDKNGLIDVHASARHYEINIPSAYQTVRLKKLRSAPGIFARKVTSFKADALEYMAGRLDARRATEFSAKSLKTVKGNMSVGDAQEVIVNKLTFVDGYVDALDAKTFSAKALEVVNGVVYVRNAEILDVPKLAKSGAFDLNPALADTETDTLIFSKRIGSESRISVFNKNTTLAKVGCRPWLPIEQDPNASLHENLRDIVTAEYFNGKYHDQYHTFFDYCKQRIT